jgi:hypothetical protein
VNQAPYVHPSSVSLSTEVRWFIPGDGPPLHKTSARSLVDTYYHDLLAYGLSVKFRYTDRPAALLKMRIAVHIPVAVNDVAGEPQTWLRRPIDPDELRSRVSEDGLVVRKRITRHQGVEVAQIEMGGEMWWSLAVRMRGSSVPRLPHEQAKHLRQHRAGAVSCSYPTWLLELVTGGGGGKDGGTGPVPALHEALAPADENTGLGSM